jgi:Flp pilus assembly pilin Flp
VAYALRNRFLWLLRGGSGSSGQTLVEYSLLLAFVASMIVALGLVVGGTDGLLDDIENALEAALG